MLIHTFIYVPHRLSISVYVVWKPKIIFVTEAWRPQEKQINIKLYAAIKI